jgi:hypothetical protein
MDLSKFTAEELTAKLKDRSPAEVAKLFASAGFATDPKLTVAEQVVQAKSAKPLNAAEQSGPTLTPHITSAGASAAPSAAPNLPPAFAPAVVSNPDVAPVTAPEAPAQAVKTYFVRTSSHHADGRFRAGRRWTNALVPVLESDLTAEQWAAMRADPLIQIREPK